MKSAVVSSILALALTPGALAKPSPEIVQIRSGLARMAKRGELSGVVLVARHGRPVFQRPYGLANRHERTPNRLGTRFNLASVGKTFTGVAVAQLVQARKLRFG